MIYFHWIAGFTLAFAWIWRLADAAFGVPKIADISRPEWDRLLPASPESALSFPPATKKPTLRRLSPACLLSTTITTKSLRWTIAQPIEPAKSWRESPQARRLDVFR